MKGNVLWIHCAAAIALSISPFAHAAATPELMSTLPADLSFFSFPGLAPGFEIDGSGNTVPAAYFALWSQSRQANEIWVTDGTSDGTHVASPVDVTNDDHPIFVSDTLGAFFQGYTNEGGWQLYRTDGPVSSSHPVAPGATPAVSMVGFVGGKPVVAQPTDAMTSVVSTLDPDTGALDVIFTTPGRYADIVTTRQAGFSFAQPATGESGFHVDAFRVDGTSPLALAVPPPNTEWDYPHRAAAGTRLACAKALTDYSANDHVEELYCSDGTVEGTRRPVVPGQDRGVHLSDAVEFFPVGDRILFYGFGTWGTDGSDAGTAQLSGSNQSEGYPCTDDTSGGVYLVGSRYEDGTYVPYLKFTDGTLQGTRIVAPLPATSYGCTNQGTSTSPGGITYLQIGTSLYQTDGTAAGTFPVAGAPSLPSFSFSERTRGMAKTGRWLVFSVVGTTGPATLWRIDLDPIFADGFQ